MRKILIFFILFYIYSYPQEYYEGFIGENKIEMNIDLDLNYANGVYLYTKYNIPIYLKGTFKENRLSLSTKNEKFIFKDFNLDKEKILGNWTNLKTNKTFQVELAKKKNKDFIQQEYAKDFYFKTSESDTFLYIYEIKSGKLFQKIDIESDARGIFDISTDDYNFDGIKDFSCCIQSYAGPNTSKTYYLFNKKLNKFVISDFGGTSLEFDSKTKTIMETNQCCAGSSIIKNIYKVKNNKMILIKEHCYKMNDNYELVEKSPNKCK